MISNIFWVAWNWEIESRINQFEVIYQNKLETHYLFHHAKEWNVRLKKFNFHLNTSNRLEKSKCFVCSGSSYRNYRTWTPSVRYVFWEKKQVSQMMKNNHEQSRNFANTLTNGNKSSSIPMKVTDSLVSQPARPSWPQKPPRVGIFAHRRKKNRWLS